MGRLAAYEMRFICDTAGYTSWDWKTNIDMLQGINFIYVGI